MIAGYRGDGPQEIKGPKRKERTIIKLGKSKSQTPVINNKSDRGNGLSTLDCAHALSIRGSNEANAATMGLQNNLKAEKVSLRKHSDSRPDIAGESNKSNKQAPPASDSLIKDSRPLLRLKFKTPYLGSWPLQGEEERGSIKGQRSKRKRPSPFVEKSKKMEQEDDLESQEDNLMNEMMDANWVLKKLGRDAVGKRVEVHQPSDNSW